MLKTERNSPAMRKRVLRAARKMLNRRYELQADFEHGQWRITHRMTGAQWSVVDAEGESSVDGFGLERVTQGDEP